MATPQRSLKGSRTAPGIRWDAVKNRYIGRDGRIVSREEVRRVIEMEVERVEAKMVADAEAFRAGRLTRAQWQRNFETGIRRAHQATAAIAKGGFQQVSRADKEWTRARVREQYAFLEKFLGEIQATPPESLDGRFVARVRLYAKAPRSTHREMGRRVAVQGGATEARWRLSRNEHCKGKGSCVEQNARGWQPIGSFPPHSSRRCLTNCKCPELATR